MKIGDFVTQVAGKAGKTEDVKAVLNNPALATIEIDDNVANEINSALLTIESAKNNQALKNHFFTLALNGEDAEILNSVETLGFDDAFKADLSSDKNTYQRLRKLTSKVKETMESLRAATQKDDPKAIEKYTAQINKLQGELSSVKESHIPKSELETLKKQHESELMNFIIKNTLSTKKYANEAVSPDVNVEFANVILNRALSEKGAALVKDATGRLKLMQASDPALEYYDSSNKAVSFDDFVNKTLADAKILAVSNPKQTQQTLPVNIPRGYQGGDSHYDNSAAMNAAISNLKD
jgi:hypothetical protein